MKTLLPAASCFAALVAAAPFAMQSERVWHFDQDPPNSAPAGYVFAAMRQPAPGRWLVERQGAQGYLVHHADPAAMGYAFAMAGELTSNDLSVSARVRFTGAVRTGGVIWRAQDSQNFYALVLDLVARHLKLYRVTSGNRIELDVQDDLELDPLAWHSLKVVHEESEIKVSLGGIGVFHERDRRYDQPAAQARVGLLAAGSADVWFDDLRVEPRKGRR